MENKRGKVEESFLLNFADGFVDMLESAIFMQFAIFVLFSRLGNEYGIRSQAFSLEIFDSS